LRAKFVTGRVLPRTLSRAPLRPTPCGKSLCSAVQFEYDLDAGTASADTGTTTASAVAAAAHAAVPLLRMIFMTDLSTLARKPSSSRSTANLDAYIPARDVSPCLASLLTATFWDALARDHDDGPNALQELARGDNSVVCDRDEAQASLEWARRHWAWTESPQPVYVENRLIWWATCQVRIWRWPVVRGTIG